MSIKEWEEHLRDSLGFDHCWIIDGKLCGQRGNRVTLLRFNQVLSPEQVAEINKLLKTEEKCLTKG